VAIPVQMPNVHHMAIFVEDAGIAFSSCFRCYSDEHAVGALMVTCTHLTFTFHQLIIAIACPRAIQKGLHMVVCTCSRFQLHMCFGDNGARTDGRMTTRMADIMAIRIVIFRMAGNTFIKLPVRHIHVIIAFRIHIS
jgi:hypothetical protein